MVLSVVVRVLLPRRSAIISINNNAPPTTQIHGCVYHVVVVVVVVLLELVLVLSCANRVTCIRHNANSDVHFLNDFIPDLFVMD